MHARMIGLRGLLVLLLALGVIAGLAATGRRFVVEAHNRRVEIAVEWPEVWQLAQATGQSVTNILETFRLQSVRSVVIPEDTLIALEQSGAVRPESLRPEDPAGVTRVAVDRPETLRRLEIGLAARGLLRAGSRAAGQRPSSATLFEVHGAQPESAASLRIPIGYTHLRPLGIGLPPEAVETVRAAGLRIAGRVGNFQGVRPQTARRVLANLHAQGAEVVIFSGEETLGYRGVEPEVAALLRDPAAVAPTGGRGSDPVPSGLTYGAVEFGKQRGEERLSAALHGDIVRVHSIQAAELATLDESDVIDRFVKAARERNIRFCYVRLLTFAGDDAVRANAEFLGKIARGMARGSLLTGGGLQFGPARRFEETRLSVVLFVLMAGAVAAGVVWISALLYPLSQRYQQRLLTVALPICAVFAAGGETGRKLLALAAALVFPAIACLRTFPHEAHHGESSGGKESAEQLAPRRKGACAVLALGALGVASLLTLIGIVVVAGLLSTRSFMMHSSQFLGIKAQHAVPLLLVGATAVLGGLPRAGESASQFRMRAETRLRAALDEPIRIGLLLLALLGVAAVVIVIVRSGNDAGVGVSGFELKIRALLDRLLPVRPRTKEFLFGHPLFVLGIAWWWRGRPRLAIPCFVAGSLGQASLLNTFCHIHTPLAISFWRDIIGLTAGALLGVALFYGAEAVLPRPTHLRIVS